MTSPIDQKTQLDRGLAPGDNFMNSWRFSAPKGVAWFKRLGGGMAPVIMSAIPVAEEISGGRLIAFVGGP